jgi:hypothetical protein
MRRVRGCVPMILELKEGRAGSPSRPFLRDRTQEQREKSRMIGPSWRAVRRSAPTAGYAPAGADPKFPAQVINPQAFVSASRCNPTDPRCCWKPHDPR